MIFGPSEWIALFSIVASISLVCFIGVQVLTPMVIRRAHRWGILDFPAKRKVHKQPTPRLGGLSIAPAFWLGCSAALIICNKALDGIALEVFSKAITGLFLGCSGMFLLGLFDDFKQMKAQQKLMVQCLIAAVSVPFLPVPQSMFGLASSTELMTFFLIAWLVVIPNSVNLLDGVDGLTSSLVSLFLIMCSILAIVSGQYFWLAITLPSIAALSSFLRFNWSPAKIFLGDSGSLSLGFLVAYLSLFYSFSGTPESGFEWNPIVGVLLTLVWITDTLFAIGRRYISGAPSLKLFIRRSKSKYLMFHGLAFKKIWKPDQGHIHHQLKRLGLHAKQIVLCLGLISFLAALGPVLMHFDVSASRALIVCLLLLLAAVSVISLVLLGKHSRGSLSLDESLTEEEAHKVVA